MLQKGNTSINYKSKSDEKTTFFLISEIYRKLFIEKLPQSRRVCFLMSLRIIMVFAFKAIKQNY